MTRAPFKPCRVKLKERRQALLRRVAFRPSGHRAAQHFDVGYGVDEAGIIREVFCTASARDGSDLKALVHDACIAISRALQWGDRIGALAASFGELREEGETCGPPASPLGAIARAGAALENELRHAAQAAEDDGA